MADVVCSVCGARNPAGVQFCESCGVELAPVARGTEEPEIDRLLEELVDVKAEEPERASAEAESLDIDKEIVDELLDSLLVEEDTAEHFDCPLCGTKLPLDATVCSKCGATFAEGPAPEVQVEAEEAPEEVSPTPSASREMPPPPEAEPVSVAVTEEPSSIFRILSGRLIDLVVLGTIGALVAIFAGFQMWRWTQIASNPGSLAAFGAVAVGGMALGFILFRVSTTAIAQGDQLTKEGRYDDAIYYYDRAIRMGSKTASAWTSKGVALKRQGKLDEALRAQTAALKLDPKNEIAWCNKGDIYFRASQMDRAIECYDKAIELRPKYAIAWNNKGAALARLERFEDAQECSDMAVKLKPRYVAAWLNRGEVLARLGNRAEAEKCLARARALGAAA